MEQYLPMIPAVSMPVSTQAPEALVA